MLGGVCGGLAAGLGADAALLRVLVVALTLITGGAAAIVYIAAWALAPEEEPARVLTGSSQGGCPPLAAGGRLPVTGRACSMVDSDRSAHARAQTVVVAR